MIRKDEHIKLFESTCAVIFSRRTVICIVRAEEIQEVLDDLTQTIEQLTLSDPEYRPPFAYH